MALGLSILCALPAELAWADRVAPAEGDDEPAAEPTKPDDGAGEPQLYAPTPAEPPRLPEVRSHKGQFGLALSLLSGGRFIKTYDQEYCGTRDDNGNTTGNSAVCLGHIPFALDLSLTYGVSPKIELMFDIRFGVERDFGSSVSDSDGPRLRHYAPGVRFYFDDKGLVKFFSTAQLAIDDTGYTSPSGMELGTDVSIRNSNGLMLDFHDAYGAYAFFAEDVAFRRWISVGVEFGAGFQGRYP